MKIQSTKDISVHKIKCLVYGESGVGKTTLASTLKGKTLIISSESGLMSLKDTDVDFIDINLDDNGEMLDDTGKVQKMHTICKALKEDKKLRQTYDNIFLDSITDMADILQRWAEKETKDSKNKFEKWTKYAQVFTSFLHNFRDIPFYNVVFVALAAQDGDEDSKTFGQWLPVVTGKTPRDKVLRPALDEIYFYTQNDNDQRILVTKQTHKNIAKNRSKGLEMVEKPDLQAIFDKIIKKENK
jgi:phage nucleotide-binding protein